MQVVLDYEQARAARSTTSTRRTWAMTLPASTNSGELRLIEVKGLSEVTGTILLTPNERRVAEDRRDCYWLYVVTNCAVQPTLQEPIKDPAQFAWHEVTKVAHYWLEVDAMTQPMRVREDVDPFGVPGR